ncbi:MAG: DUF892 family protein [Armatimonadetes bacterium]|nr:DUF892 family protein [Akkermansiaceae bacterium]
MKNTHHDSLIRYVNDVIAMERDIVNAVRTQMEDTRVKEHPELKALFMDIAVHSDHRIQTFEKIIKDDGGSLGGAVKEGIAAITGVVAGLYGMARLHPLSRMVRDNTIAMDVAAVSYSMLVTLALAIGHKRCEELAISALNDCPKFVLQLTQILPHVVVAEISEDAPVLNATAAQEAQKLIREAWNHHQA